MAGVGSAGAVPLRALKRAQCLPVGLGLYGRFIIRRVIAEGGFGQIYEAVDVEEERLVAVKAEASEAALPLLRVELQVYRSMDDAPGSPRTHFLRTYAHGESEGTSFLVLDLVGPNLMELKKGLGTGRLSTGTSLRMGAQMLRALQHLHSLGWLHRDVKPSNFCLGRGDEDARTVFLLDFGLARLYRHSSGAHKDPRPNPGFRGTLRYASTNIHAGTDMGRRDDLHSLYYLMAEQVLGQLPWRRLTDRAAVGEEKAAWTPAPDALPASLAALALAARALAFHDAPPYDDLLHGFRADLRLLAVHHSDPLDWEPHPI